MSPLRLHRLAGGWPQWDLSRRSGVSIHKISFAERGLSGALCLADRRRLAATLNVAMEALFPGAGAAHAAAAPASPRILAYSDATDASAASEEVNS